MEKLYEELEKILGKQKIKLKEPMKNHTSFKIGGEADFFVIVDKEQELKDIIKLANENKIYTFILGNGTNLLVKDNGIRGIVIKLNFKEVIVNKEDAIIEFGASIDMKEASKIALENSLQGFEFACGIPGSIGGGIRMNAGAYGGEMKDILLSVRALEKDTGKIEEIKNTEENFKYRSTIFRDNNYVIISAKFGLKQGNYEEIKSKVEELTYLRESKQPLKYPSAGSTFKRGEGFLTSLLIEQAGLKGTRIGDAAVSEMHGGFVVNVGNATAKDVLDLVDYIKEKIKDLYGKEIELEVEVIGE